MAHKTTVTLPDETHAAWKKAGMPLAEVIRRGLDGTGDTARHVAAETRLAGIEQRIAKLEAAGTLFPANDDPAEGDWDSLTLEEIEQRHEAQQRARAAEWHRGLARNVQPDKHGLRVVTANNAAGALRCSGSAARDRLHTLASLGLAKLLNDEETPHRWLIHDQAADVSAQ